jgi:hypothetical protein
MLSKPASSAAPVTRDHLIAGLRTIRIVADAIREEGTIPAGIVYAALSQHGITLPGFESIVGILSREGLLKRIGDSLVWIGPTLEGGAA